jgi:serine/threonine-protein kinase
LGAERFLREIEIAAKLSHPNILPVHDSGANQGVLYYVMPLVEGESLPARLKREKQLPVAEALRLTREVAEALAYAHKRGIVHRDIKPANILISEGHALVADFGIARAAGAEGNALTATGLAIGTPQYMSPEQASGEPNLDGRSDIYALGCVLYEMLAGEPPFTGPTAQAIITRSITEDPRPLTRARAGVAPAIDTAVMRALAKSPADRYTNATEMVTSLHTAEDVARSGSGPVQPPFAVRRSPFASWKIAAAAVLVLGLGAVGWKMFGTGGGATDPVRSMAVLPFQNQGSADDAYFADGIVDELRDRLARLDKFTVIASASADQYRETTKSAIDIAKELRVDQVLMGSVRWATGADGTRQFKVTTELVDGATGQVTWRETFDGDVSDPFEVQGQIATRVASALGTALGGSDQTDLAGRPTDNAEAYDLFLKGRAIIQNSAGASRDKASLMERAVALDSNFFQAWGHLAVALANQYGSGTRDPVVARRAREAMEKTLALGPDSAAAHMVASNYFGGVARDQAAARREAEEAFRLDPKLIWAIRTMAAYDLTDGNYQAMFEKLARAREIDPLDKGTLSSLIRAQIYIGQYPEALATAKELAALGTTNFAGMQWIAAAYIANNDLDGAKRAIAELSKNVPVTELVAYFAGYHEMAWLLSDEQRQLLYRMTPASFDDDRAWWGQALSTAAFQQGDRARAAAWADSSLAVARQQVDAAPDDAQLRILNAASLAIVGKKAEALREAEMAIADTAGLDSDNIPYVLHQYVRTLLAANERERAIDVLSELLQRQYYVTPGYLKSDPMYRPLDGNPRFERLANRGIGAPVD